MELTRDDERARRVCSLALEFMNAQAPVPSSAVARAHYPDLSPDSFRRAFSRDRETLALCGVIVRERPVPGEESLWEVDAERSFAQGAELSATDAAALEIACQPLLDEQGFPLAGELRMALAKLSRAFAESLVSASPASRGGSRVLAVLRSCLSDCRAAEVSYVDAQGRRSRRTLAPYGFFSLRGCLYLVAARLTDGGAAQDSLCTYRIDRFSSARELPDVAYEVPGDFSVADWRRLPFQLGPALIDAIFEVPQSAEADVRRFAGAQGSFERREGRVLWTVSASDEHAAASWAIAAGITPVAPASLVSAWREALEGVLADAR